MHNNQPQQEGAHHCPQQQCSDTTELLSGKPSGLLIGSAGAFAGP